MKEFAPQYSRYTVKGNDWVNFPTNDREFRLKHFIRESLEHQAKANLYMVEALIEYQSEPGDRILDITAGTGSILIGALSGRHVSMVEINPELVGYIDKSAEKMGG